MSARLRRSNDPYEHTISVQTSLSSFDTIHRQTLAATTRLTFHDICTTNIAEPAQLVSSWHHKRPEAPPVEHARFIKAHSENREQDASLETKSRDKLTPRLLPEKEISKSWGPSLKGLNLLDPFVAQNWIFRASHHRPDITR